MGTTIRTQGSGKYTFGLALSAGLAGLLYGYDTVSISGAIEFLRAKYGLDTLMEGFVISSIMLGAVIGAATAGFLSDKFGRRRILIIGGAFFFVAAIWSALTVGPIDLIAARMVGGYGIGLTAALAVTYITESAPTNIRGLLSFSYQMLAVCGIFLTNVINYIIASYGTNDWDVDTGWRWMLGLGAIPAAAFLLAMMAAPESPRFLIQAGKTNEGFTVLEHILGTERARLRTDDISASVKLENEMSHEFHDLFRPGLLKALGIGIFLAVANQFVGMNAISYYGPVMFADMGFGGDTEFLAAASVGGVELVATVIGMYLIDTFGRKRLMEVGASLMCLFALCISASYLAGRPLLTLIFVMAFTASFAFSMGPIPWIVIPELFPTYLRGRATGLCVMCLLFANWVIAQFTPMMLDGLGGGVSFAIFGAFDLMCLFGIVLLVPETMGRTLEEIEHLWQPKTELASARYALSSAGANIRHAEATLRRIENERVQAMGIMTAAQHARIAAQQKIFDIETAARQAEAQSEAEGAKAQAEAEGAKAQAEAEGAKAQAEAEGAKAQAEAEGAQAESQAKAQAKEARLEAKRNQRTKAVRARSAEPQTELQTVRQGVRQMARQAIAGVRTTGADATDALTAAEHSPNGVRFAQSAQSTQYPSDDTALSAHERSAAGMAQSSTSGNSMDSADSLDSAIAKTSAESAAHTAAIEEAAARAAVDALADTLPDDLSMFLKRSSTRLPASETYSIAGTDSTGDVDNSSGVSELGVSNRDANRNTDLDAMLDAAVTRPADVTRRTSISSVERSQDIDSTRGVLLPTGDSAYDGQSYSETKDDREARAIDAALDSLDALIKA
ncbi:sugar porter family MFS transporter [Bifidobacterium sp. UTBIF-78]|uniref:sugar porter family MFS transporter n=1 Tax=Bifidobacterium sp. UTBIF-78 TaxID=1465263 RepID=UPI00215952F2|nr:sugar porter family MFS transporter [Bifidobacterium sp. UTBIF-78]